MATVTGHLREVNGYYHIVLNFTGEDGKRKNPSKTTGLPVKGNKKKAERMLREAIEDKQKELETCKEFGSPVTNVIVQLTFTQFMKDWLAMMKSSVEISTFTSYARHVNNEIIPYFDTNYPGLMLIAITPKHIQDYYSYLMNDRNLSANTVIHFHANIRKALQYAFQTDLLKSNPADRVQRPKIMPYVGSFYSEKEANQLLKAVKGDPVEFGVMMALYYGLRRSEVIGLKWSAIDFEQKKLTINHVVVVATVDGKCQMVPKDRAKNKSSRRSLPLIPVVEEYLLQMKKEQERNRLLCGACYCQDYLEYVYVNSVGELVKPGFLSIHLGMILEKNGLRHIRFHDLRHSCASLLLSNGVSMKQIQEWLGHSNYSTTANIYAHLDSESKMASAAAIANILNFAGSDAS